jgi:HEAT repeat protein
MKILLCTLLLLLTTAASLDAGAAQAQRPAAATTAFREARDLIGEVEWQRAEARFNSFIANFPQDRDVPAALYWLAFSLKQQNKFPATDAALTRLIQQHPSSTWANDARAMRVEIAPRLRNNQVIDQGASDSDDEIRLAALQSLFESRPERAVAMAADILKQGSSASRLLKEGAVSLLGDSETTDAIPVLVQVARNETDMRVRRKSIQALSEYEDLARRPLLEIVRSNASIEVRAEAIEALGEIENAPAVVDDLVSLMSTLREPALQKQVIESLGDIELAQAETALAELARTASSVDLRLEAIEALSDHETETAAESLVRLYDLEKDPRVKEGIIDALGDTESRAALQKLNQIAAQETSTRLKRLALEAIEDLEESLR